MKKLIITSILLLLAFSSQAQRVAATNINGTERMPVTDAQTGLGVGSDFSVALYAGADEASLAPVASGSFLAAGLFNLNDVDTGLAAGATGFFQVKAWETAFGATYDEALGLGKTGESNVFSMAVTTDVDGQPLPFASNLVQGGLESFEVVPEPSTIVLGVLGAAALALRRRK